ncbi:4-hydroxy-tetrahydrodipicolinate synthase [Rhodocytophaga rosea]|uniref:4-hydroxy-tetrahydrodipicolinate synthase n=1 Tax=Rhodocytophaga rosea TaxID=2704465 RepID=A0A6C0GCY0_9BACT|nr:4-hydroxy-tetrahydrodipicolinate synthase [Rhodocytophaga rosea]QHT65815.1 4-hydroxy-tetrahydrodipicolinate synthase [Rhodocytophaga rosea]
MRSKFLGTGVALITPFQANGEIDFGAMRRLLEHVSQGVVDYLVVLGTTGESATLNEAEKKDILAFVKANNPKRLPIMYGLGGNNTREVLEQIHQTDWQGVDAVLSVSPYYNKPSQRGIYEHYVSIADACPVPVVLYNVPGRTQSNVTATTTLKLATHPNIIGIKEASGDLIQCMEIAKNKPSDFLLISGDDLLTLPMVSFGAIGVISVLANAFPAIFTQMVNEALDHQLESASRHLFRFLAINPLMYEEGNPVGLKQVLQQMGICRNEVRLPLAPASEPLIAKITAALMEFEPVFQPVSVAKSF